MIVDKVWWTGIWQIDGNISNWFYQTDTTSLAGRAFDSLDVQLRDWLWFVLYDLVMFLMMEVVKCFSSCELREVGLSAGTASNRLVDPRRQMVGRLGCASTWDPPGASPALERVSELLQTCVRGNKKSGLVLGWLAMGLAWWEKSVAVGLPHLKNEMVRRCKFCAVGSTR